MELEMKISKKVMQRLLTALLAVALVLGCVNVPTEAAQESAEPSAKAAEAAKVSSKEPTAKTSSRYWGDMSLVEDCTALNATGSTTLTYEIGQNNYDYNVQWVSFTPTETGKYKFVFEYGEEDDWNDFYSYVCVKGTGWGYEYNSDNNTNKWVEKEGLVYYDGYMTSYSIEGSAYKMHYLVLGCQANTTYYIELEGYSSLSGTKKVTLTPSKVTKEVSGFEVTGNNKFFPYFRYDADSKLNGRISARLSYTDGTTVDLQTDNYWRSRNKLNYKDENGYWLATVFKGSNTDKWNWWNKEPGTYQFDVVVYGLVYDAASGSWDTDIVASKTITRTIVSLSDTFQAEGLSAQTISYGTAANVSSGLQVYSFTAQFDGCQVLNYSGIKNLYRDIKVYASDNERVYMTHGKNSVYGNFSKGETYYVFVDADNAGSISLNYYNGATNPNAAAAAAAQQSAATTNPTQLTLNQTVTAQGGTYVVTSVGAVPTVTLTKAMAGKSISVPAQVNINGVNAIVTGIGANCFAKNKKLKSVTIPASVTSIGKNAFKGCKNLKKITLSAAKLKKIGKGAFAKINKKAVIKIKGKKKQKKALIKKIRKSKIAKSVKIR